MSCSKNTDCSNTNRCGSCNESYTNWSSRRLCPSFKNPKCRKMSNTSLKNLQNVHQIHNSYLRKNLPIKPYIEKPTLLGMNNRKRLRTTTAYQKNLNRAKQSYLKSLQKADKNAWHNAAKNIIGRPGRAYGITSRNNVLQKIRNNNRVGNPPESSVNHVRNLPKKVRNNQNRLQTNINDKLNGINNRAEGLPSMYRRSIHYATNTLRNLTPGRYQDRPNSGIFLNNLGGGNRSRKYRKRNKRTKKI